MTIQELADIIKSSGTVGAGGAGFPTYAKLSDKAEVILLNCAECEPLLKLHRQLLAAHPQEIVSMLDEVRRTIGAKEAVVGIKSEYRTTIEALQKILPAFPQVRTFSCPV